MATVTRTFVDLTYMDADGIIDHEEFELEDDVTPVSVKVYRKEVETT